jgi:vacuolar-type H+-ATPase subunit F/Vma7
MSNFKMGIVGDKDLTQIFKVIGMDTFADINEVPQDEYALILSTQGGANDKPYPIIMEVKL